MEDNSVPPDLFLKSPYLNVSVLPDDQYIYYNNQPKIRGRMEHSFVQIGTAVMVGGALGGLRGFIQGKEATKGHLPHLHRVLIFNQVVKMSKLGNTLGVIALIYSGIGIAISELRGKDDYANTILASTATGYLYKCTSGFKKMVYAGALGFTIGTAVSLWNGKSALWYEWCYVADRFMEGVRTKAVTPNESLEESIDSSEHLN